MKKLFKTLIISILAVCMVLTFAAFGKNPPPPSGGKGGGVGLNTPPPKKF